MTTEELLDRFEVGALIGVDPDTVTYYASQTRVAARHRALTEYDFPLPERHVERRRERPTGMGPRWVSTPLWSRTKVLAQREAITRRPPPERDRDPEGRYLAKDQQAS